MGAKSADEETLANRIRELWKILQYVNVTTSVTLTSIFKPHRLFYSEGTNKQLYQPLQFLHITEQKEEMETGNVRERRRLLLLHCLPCLNFFTHSGVECKLCMDRAGGTTKQALLCERWIGSWSQRVYLCCWTITREMMWKKIRDAGIHIWTVTEQGIRQHGIGGMRFKDRERGFLRIW